ncbi:MAG TPA: toll/interleukin-1 receptor domain-containing protein [Steroidobacteraceae bacterium]
MEQRQYRAFLSYSHRDAKWAEWLHKGLEAYHPPNSLVGTHTVRGTVPKRLHPIFRDREELASATDLGSVINAALEHSACQIVICSPQAAKSRWVNEEILAFKRLGREDRIFCLIVDGEPNATDMPGRADEECFPPALRFRIGADGELTQARTEPIAADARPGKDGKQPAKLKLIAGVLGVGYDALRRREQQRRARRLFAVTCAALGGMVITSGLAGYALYQRAAAQRETRRAEAEAETAKQTTNFLVDLFRISDPGEARGNTVTAREMLDKGAARIDRELAQQPAIQATLMDTVGTVYMGLGLYKQARPLLDRAVAQRRAFAAADPVVLSDSLSHLGDLETLQADFGPGEKSYREAIAFESAQRPTPQNRAALAKSLHGLGVALQREGRDADAEQSFRAALELQRRVLGPAHPDIAATLQDLAKVIDDEGNLKTAIPVMQQALDMQRQLNGTQPEPRLAETINDMGILLYEGGNYDGAAKLYLEAIAMKRRLLGDKHPEIALTLSNLARVLQDKGDLAGAEARFREALAMQRQTLGDLHPDVANTLNNIAFVQYDRGDKQGAVATEREALEVDRKLFAGDHPEVARIENRIGFWLTESGQYAEADQDLQDALAMRRRLFGDQHPDVAGSLDHLALLQVARGQNSEALASAREAVAIFSTKLSPNHWKTAVGECAEGAALANLKQYAEADPLLTHSLGILSKDADAPAAYRSLAEHYLAQLHDREARAQSSSSTTAVATAQRPTPEPTTRVLP